MHWPCMHTKNKDIDNYLSNLRGTQACTTVPDDRALKEKRRRMIAYRNARRADPNQYYGAPWTNEPDTAE